MEHVPWSSLSGCRRLRRCTGRARCPRCAGALGDGDSCKGLRVSVRSWEPPRPAAPQGGTPSVPRGPMAHGCGLRVGGRAVLMLVVVTLGVHGSHFWVGPFKWVDFTVCELHLGHTVSYLPKAKFCPQRLVRRAVLIGLNPPLQRVLHGEVCHEQLLWHRPGREDLPGLQQQA